MTLAGFEAGTSQVVATGGVQSCVRTGEPPVQPAGSDDATVRVCVPSAEQEVHSE